MSEVRALVVDFGGVLTTSILESLDRFARELEVDLGTLASAALGAYGGTGDDLVTDFETGRIDEDQFSRRFAQRLSDLVGRPVDAEGLVGRMLGALRLEPVMLDLIRQVKGRGIQTALLSNSWGTDSYPRALLAELFDVCVISGEVGLRKPDPKIFELVCERLGQSPRDCVFVDDHPGHLKPASDLGFTTVLHRSPEETVQEVALLLGLEKGA